MQFKTKSVRLCDINIIDGDTQQREKINTDVVEEYAEAMRCGAKFTPVILFFDGVQYWIADGFHRYYASKSAEMLDILADVHEGTKRDARLYSAGANGTHGMRLTNADKRRSVLVLLLDQEWSAWTNRDIAKHCHVSHEMVNKLRGELSGKENPAKTPHPKPQEKVATVATPATQPNNGADVVFELPKKEAAASAEANPSQAAEHDPEADMHAEMLADAIDALREENESLRNQLAAMVFSGSDAEKSELLDRLNKLTEENRKLHVLNRGLEEARDRVMRENVSLRKQGEYAAKRLKQLEKVAA